jgi:hypothetical protein
MPSFQLSTAVITLGLLVLFARPAHAFGAGKFCFHFLDDRILTPTGNIASTSTVEGTNWRHGDIEDTLLLLAMSRAAGGRKFDKINVARVYFGNWLRDYCESGSGSRFTSTLVHHDRIDYVEHMLISIQLKPLMLAPSSTSQLRPSAFFSGSSAS